MDDSDKTIDQLMMSDLDKKRDQALVLGTRQNTKALNALSARGFDIQKVIGYRLEDLNKTIEAHRIETTKSLDGLTRALKSADKSAGAVSRASNRLTLFLVIGTLVQAAVAITLLFKH